MPLQRALQKISSSISYLYGATQVGWWLTIPTDIGWWNTLWPRHWMSRHYSDPKVREWRSKVNEATTLENKNKEASYCAFCSYGEATRLAQHVIYTLTSDLMATGLVPLTIYNLLGFFSLRSLQTLTHLSGLSLIDVNRKYYGSRVVQQYRNSNSQVFTKTD